jgi:Lrp/AsnC family leucine-responsive transcriptional regulator
MIAHQSRGNHRGLDEVTDRDVLSDHMNRGSRLDDIDRKILATLQENARIANVELADEIHLSPSPCLARVKVLEREGFISRYVTLLDPRAIGLAVNAFIQVRLERQIDAAMKQFEAATIHRPEIMECYLMTGTSDYLLRVAVSNLDALQEFVTEFLAKIPGIGNIQSSIALKQVKHKTALPI